MPSRPAGGRSRGRWLLLRLLAAFLAASTAAAATVLPPDNPVPGGVARVTLGQPELETLAARFGSHRVPVYKEFGRWTALVGLPISIEPGRYIVTLEAEELEAPPPVEFSVKPSRTTVMQKSPPAPEPPPQTLSKKEKRKLRETIRAMTTRWTDGPFPDFSFTAPAAGELLYPYSLVENRDTGESSDHDYVSYLAAAGSPIVAPRGGTVLGIVKLPELGRTLFIDHGQGLISMLSGLGEIAVEEEQSLQRGDIVGNVPEAADRPYLEVNWALFLNGQKIDPEPFVEGTSQLSSAG